MISGDSEIGSEEINHIITYGFYGYRCMWLCSCGVGQRRTGDTYLGARRSSLAHLSKVGGDLNQPYLSKSCADLLKDFKKVKVKM
jgi:hypothetical protein